MNNPTTFCLSFNSQNTSLPSKFLTLFQNLKLNYSNTFPQFIVHLALNFVITLNENTKKTFIKVEWNCLVSWGKVLKNGKCSCVQPYYLKCLCCYASKLLNSSTWNVINLFWIWIFRLGSSPINISTLIINSLTL